MRLVVVVVAVGLTVCRLLVAVRVRSPLGCVLMTILKFELWRPSVRVWFRSLQLTTVTCRVPRVPALWTSTAAASSVGAGG